MDNIPSPLTKMLEELDGLDRVERAQYLLELSDDFSEVPEAIATRPFPENRRVPKCESEAFVWAQDQDDGTLKFHYAVENPLGISARAMGVILDETLSGQPVDQVASVPPDIVHRIFGRQLSMGKGEGLAAMVEFSTYEARRRLQTR
ncbi:MAG: SufE family protein [Chloroflexi bacterium]|nr:SufE family protein [Chloroflexota bacterium]